MTTADGSKGAVDLPPADRIQVLQALRQDALRTAKPIRRRSPETETTVLSPAQQRLWVLDQLRPGESVYNECAAWRLAGQLDVQALERSVTEIMRRHEALRTIFPTTDGLPVQAIQRPRDLKVTVLDLSRMAEEEREEELRRATRDEARRPFELARGPLVRMLLIRLSPRDHVLMLTAHHIVLDGWSVGIFKDELTRLYAAYRAGVPAPLGDLPFQYADYAVWQQQRFAERDFTGDIEYWTRQLQGLPPLFELPISRARPQSESFAGAREEFALSQHLRERLGLLSRRHGATLFMGLLSGFQALLHRYTGDSDVPVGTAVADRDHEGLDRLIGFFVNTLVLRGRLDGDMTFAQLLRDSRELAISAYEHSEVPFEHLVDALGVERSSAYNPLFQVMFVFENVPQGELCLPELTVEAVPVETGAAKYDLTLSMKETAEGIHGVWEYNRDLFAADAVARMSGHLSTLLEGAIDDPDRPIAGLPLLTPAERRTVFFDWNNTYRDFPSGRCIHELFEEQVARSPIAPAVISGNDQVSYSALNQRANRLARLLRRRGVEPGSSVGVCLTRSADMLVGVLGVLKAGCAYVPLDPSYPKRRLESMIEDAAVAALVTHTAATRDAEALTVSKVVDLDVDRDDLDREPENDLRTQTTADAAAYVIFTSGSTGRPKGVMVTHRNVVHSTTSRWDFYGPRVGRFLLVSPLTFDSSVAGIFWTLTSGGALVLPPEDGSWNAPALCRLIESRKVSHVLAIPSLYELILESAEPDQLATLDCVILAGEPCRGHVVNRHRVLLGDVEIYNEYGPTEATVWSTVYRCEAEEPAGDLPVGRPISNTRIYVLDDRMQPVPFEVTGEVWIGGAGVARGYANDPELTVERFVEDPFAERPGARLYRSGDRGRFRQDGTLELRGRLDGQVKVRGARVDVSEVEQVLAEHPLVREAVVELQAGNDGRGRLVGYVALDGRGSASAQELQEFAQERLPGFAVPAELVFVERLPRLPNGKLDRTAISADHQESSGDSTEAGLSDLEQTITAIWQETLEATVDRDANFFQIGGDSLSAVRVYNRLRGVTSREFAITDVFKYPTIRDLAAFLGE